MRSEGGPARRGDVLLAAAALLAALAGCYGDEEDARCVLSRSCGGGTSGGGGDTSGGGGDTSAGGGALECEPGEASSCPSDCPALRGHTVSCNAQGHCEYAPVAPIVTGALERLIWVPASSFPMGSPAGEGPSDDWPQHCVSFAAGYFVGKHEVTSGAFAAFLTSRGSNECSYGGGSAACRTSSGNVRWDGASQRAFPASDCEASAGGAPDGSCASHPATGVTWYGAGAFCVWVGGRLCTESEWERGAKGTSDRLYPWGSAAPDGTLANCSEGYCGDGFDATSPVGSFSAGASPVGALDMGGNVWEWVEDDWHGSYADAPDDGTAWSDSPRAAVRVDRGGSWDAGAAFLRAADRGYYGPFVAVGNLGFRCCRSAY